MDSPTSARTRQSNEEKQVLDALVDFILQSDTTEEKFTLLMQKNQRARIFGSLLNSRGASVLSELQETPSEVSDLNDIFATASMRRYFLERITSEAKLSRDYPVPREKWSKLRLLTGVLIESI